MECEKQGNQDCYGNWQNVGCHDVVGHFVVKTAGVVDGPLQDGVGRANNCPGRSHAVENHAQEVFVIVKAHTVGDPRAVVVHLKDTSVALGAVVATVGFSLVAPLADANAAVAFLLNWNNNFLTLFFGWHDTLVRGLGLGLNKRTLRRDEILVVFVLVVLWELNPPLYLAVSEAPIRYKTWSMLTLVLGQK
jgi:hypothetical protein